MTLIFAFIFGIPVLFYVLYLSVKKPWIGFTISIIIHYFIMGLARYVNIPVPVSVITEFYSIFLIIILLVNNREKHIEGNKVPFSLIMTYGIWTLYCVIEVINDTCNLGINIVGWYREVRFYGFDPLLSILIFGLVICNKKDITNFLYIIGTIIILAGIKCFMQRNFGFDFGETNWLESGGKITHIIYAGTFIRYFSFFTDAANYGSHSAIMACIFSILMLYLPVKEWKKKLFYLIVAIAGFYGMFLSGARAAMFVAIGTVLAYIFLSKNIKMFSLSTIGLIFIVGMLMFTNKGNSIESVRRMRTAFNLEDASVQVRDHNKEAISKYMKEAPLGLGLGQNVSTVPTYSRYRIVVETPPDSTLVYLWTRTGVIGITLFCFISLIILFRCSLIVWFNIKDKELRTICGTFTAAGAGWFFAGYANNIYFQYPNSLVIFGMLTIVYMAPYLDKKLQEEKEQKELDNLEIQDIEIIND